MRLNSEQNDDECLSSSLHPNESVTITIYDDGDDEQIDFEPKKHRALIHYLFGGLLLFAFIFGILSFWNAHSKSKLNDDVERNLLMEDYRANKAHWPDFMPGYMRRFAQKLEEKIKLVHAHNHPTMNSVLVRADKCHSYEYEDDQNVWKRKEIYTAESWPVNEVDRTELTMNWSKPKELGKDQYKQQEEDLKEETVMNCINQILIQTFGTLRIEFAKIRVRHPEHTLRERKDHDRELYIYTWNKKIENYDAISDRHDACKEIRQDTKYLDPPEFDYKWEKYT